MTLDEPHDLSRLRVGELAKLAGTTTRTIRHYHAIGLMKEPDRDESGYRRYGAWDLVTLMRIRRLREIDMPLEQIAAHIAGGPQDADGLAAGLRALADDITRQIEKLEAIRAATLELAASDAAGDPAQRWESLLRYEGVLDSAAPLPASERRAVHLLDALHPAGVDGVIADSSELMADPARREALDQFLTRFRTLPDDDAAIEQLAADAAAVLPRPENAPPSVDVDLMDKLVGDRFTPAQRRCMHRLRELLEARDR